MGACVEQVKMLRHGYRYKVETHLGAMRFHFGKDATSFFRTMRKLIDCDGEGWVKIADDHKVQEYRAGFKRVRVSRYAA